MQKGVQISAGVQRSAVLRLLIVSLLLVSLQTSSAFFFKPKPRKHAARQLIDPECVERVRNGDCRFYKCFNERHRCPDSDNYAMEFGWRFCSRFDLSYNQLTDEGKRWLNGTRLCAMERMLEFYREEAISCSEVGKEMGETQAACEAENGLCGDRLLVDNKNVFSDVYALNRQSAVHFLHSVKQCTLTKLRETSNWFREQLHGFGELGQSIVPFFQDLEKRMDQLKESIQVEFNQLQQTVQQIGKKIRSRGSHRNSKDAE